jgi:hypothetical protein
VQRGGGVLDSDSGALLAPLGRVLGSHLGSVLPRRGVLGSDMG